MPDEEALDLPAFLTKKPDAPLRATDAVPLAVERAQLGGKSYEEANWARLSPAFRNAHNRLRQMRGLPTIPPPKIDLYVPPKAPALNPFDPADPDFLRSVREFNGPILGPRGGEGMTINGKEVR